jgi:hypothetical protein
LTTIVTLEYVTKLGDDARKSLLTGLQLTGQDGEGGKLEVFNRPCHSIGLRLMFPPFAEVPDTSGGETEEFGEASLDDPDGPDDAEDAAALVPANRSPWNATLTLQSLADDPASISVEVDGRWHPAPWSQVGRLVADRLSAVDDFLRTRTVQFLRFFKE